MFPGFESFNRSKNSELNMEIDYLLEGTKEYHLKDSYQPSQCDSHNDYSNQLFMETNHLLNTENENVTYLQDNISIEMNHSNLLEPENINLLLNNIESNNQFLNELNIESYQHPNKVDQYSNEVSKEDLQYSNETQVELLPNKVDQYSKETQMELFPNHFPFNWLIPNENSQQPFSYIQNQSEITLINQKLQSLLKFGFNLNELNQASHSNSNLISSVYSNAFILNTMLHPINIETYSKKKNVLIAFILNPQHHLNISIEAILSSSDFDLCKFKSTEISFGVYSIEYSIIRKASNSSPKDVKTEVQMILEFYSNRIKFDSITTPNIQYKNTSSELSNPNGNLILKHKNNVNENIDQNEQDVTFMVIGNHFKDGKIKTETRPGQQLIISFQSVDTNYSFHVPQFIYSIIESERPKYTHNENRIIKFNGNTIEFRVVIKKGTYNIQFYYDSRKGRRNIISQITNYTIKFD